jgi:putative endonuclease
MPNPRRESESRVTMAYIVYILQSEKDSSYYVGHTSNVDDRLTKHNEGRSAYTRAKVPWKLIHQEPYPSRGEAMKREQEIKGRKNREYIEYLVRTSPGQ